MTIEYVAGLMFSPDLQRVALIRKLRGPPLLIGKLNAIGGKMEAGDKAAYYAMVREFWQKTGLYHERWRPFRKVLGDGYVVWFFRAISERVDYVISPTDETVSVHEVRSLDVSDVAPDLLSHILLPAVLPLGVEHSPHDVIISALSPHCQDAAGAADHVLETLVVNGFRVVPSCATAIMRKAAAGEMARRKAAMGESWFSVSNKAKAAIRWEAMLAAWHGDIP